MAEVTCSFCGRNKKDVDLMISGIHAHICDKCITQANQILTEETKSKTVNAPKFNLIKPVDMKTICRGLKCESHRGFLLWNDRRAALLSPGDIRGGKVNSVLNIETG